MQRLDHYEIIGTNAHIGVPPCLLWALDETALQYCPKERRTQVADQSEQVYLRKSNDSMRLTSTPCVSPSGEVVCMQIIARGKTPWLHANIRPGGLLHDAVYQEHSETKAQTGATFERLPRTLAEKAHDIRQHLDIPEDLPKVFIMESVASHSQEALTPIKGHLHQFKNHPEKDVLD